MPLIIKTNTMKHLISLLMLLFCTIVPTLRAQQVQQLKRSHTVFLFPEFQDAKVRQSFGRFAKAKANIFLKDASLVFMQDGKVIRAYTKGIFGVDFGDSLHYMKVDSAMAKVVAQDGYNYLLCVTTVDMKRYHAETNGGSELPFFDMSDFNVFLQMDGQQREEDMGLPLQDKYYFSVKGQIVPANETAIRKIVAPEQKKAFKLLMGNRLWSWQDPENLKDIFGFLPK